MRPAFNLLWRSPRLASAVPTVQSFYKKKVPKISSSFVKKKVRATKKLAPKFEFRKLLAQTRTCCRLYIDPALG